MLDIYNMTHSCTGGGLAAVSPALTPEFQGERWHLAADWRKVAKDPDSAWG